MIDAKILESEWVQSKRDRRGREPWGHELKDGAPDDVKKAFQEFLNACAREDEMIN